MSTYNSGNHGASEAIHAEHNQAVQQLAGIQAHLASRGLGAAFLRAAKADPVGDMGFVGSMILHAIVGGSFADFLQEHLPHSPWMTEHLNEVSMLGSMEAASLLSETEARRARTLCSAFYPVGRRKAPIKEAKAKRGFNKVAANQNGRFSSEVQSGLARMFELIDVIDKLEKQRNSNNGQPVRKKAAAKIRMFL
jgi:hypothetical protein